MSDRLTEIEARVNAATAGPWKVLEKDEQAAWGKYDLLFCNDIVTTGVTIPRDEFDREDEQVPADVTCGTHPGGFYSSDDAEFAAHAREDVPWLIERLKAAEWLIQNFYDNLKTPSRQPYFHLRVIHDRCKAYLENRK